MSRSPLDPPVDSTIPQDYAESFLALRHMLRQGSGWSGHERNCVFLNTGTQSFADVSALSGIDFDDDGRAVAIVDWDFDGDLDLWMSNRTGPRVRFLRNDAGDGGRFVAVRLVGTKSNRDAVGARVELRTSRGARVLRSRRAGEGFLGQSSRWLHFGLGPEPAGLGDPVEVVVRWPNGSRETFTGLGANAFFELVEGSAATSGATRWTPPARRLALEAKPVAPPDADAAIRIALATRVPAPDLGFRTFDGEAKTLAAYEGRPVLVNLWASWCAPCAKELREITEREKALRNTGIDVLALSVDGIGPDPAGSPEAARRFLDELDFPFVRGMAEVTTLDMVELLHGALIHTLRPFPVPTSLLIDSEGWLVAVYQGAVDIDQLLRDIDVLLPAGARRRDVALPFAGRWAEPPGPFDYLDTMGLDFIDAGYPQHAETHYRKLLRAHGDKAVWHNNLGLAIAAQGRAEEAEQAYRRALLAAPDNSQVLYNLGTTLIQRAQPQEAYTLLQRAAALDTQSGEIQGSLGLAALALGRIDESERHLRAALDKQPDHVAAANSLAWILASREGASASAVREAIELAERAVSRTGGNEAPILDTLSAAYARAGRLDDALSTARQALSLARAANQTQLAQQIQQRITTYEGQRAAQP